MDISVHKGRSDAEQASSQRPGRAAALAERPGAEAEPMGLYIHWPFCLSKCPYCDFNSHVRESIDTGRWMRAYRRAIANWAERLPGRRIETVFFGGGTPSLMPPELVGAILDEAARHWPLDADAEITLEANPTSVEAGRFAGYRAAGVNRVSLGIQALDDAALAFLGRQHSAAEALTALDLAQQTFPRVTFDLIYARAGQTAASWRRELEKALSFGTSHLSLYQLTIEPGTAFAERYRKGGLPLLGEEESADLFLLTQEMTAAEGLPAYEISNHARKGEESRHNLLYWRYLDYLGIGPGAHGRISEGGRLMAATVERRAPEAWLEAVEATGSGLSTQTEIAEDDRAAEALMMGLRLKEGIDPDRFQRRTGRPLSAMLDQQALLMLREEGLLRKDTLALTDAGWPLLNSIVAALIC
jgi:oxygen-independent coproporphyrinogen-3 oxidase